MIYGRTADGVEPATDGIAAAKWRTHASGPDRRYLNSTVIAISLTWTFSPLHSLTTHHDHHSADCMSPRLSTSILHRTTLLRRPANSFTATLVTRPLSTRTMSSDTLVSTLFARSPPPLAPKAPYSTDLKTQIAKLDEHRYVVAGASTLLLTLSPPFAGLRCGLIALSPVL